MHRKRRPRLINARLILAAGTLLQLTACLGPDPLFFLTSSAANAAVATVVSGALSSVLAGNP